MADQTFETFVSGERARLGKEREKLLAKRNEIDDQLSGIDREMAAINAYEQAKAGKLPTTTKRTSTGSGGRRTGQRDAVLAVIKAAPNGIGASAVIEKMGATTDADKTSVRNALSALKRSFLVDTKDGNYIAK